jgi:5-methylcytosine-specific restriction endonuclease McrBC regulatory subunit McrC
MATFSKKKGGATIDFRSMRTNQALVNDKGDTVSRLRPDIQFRTSDNNFHIYEISVSQTEDMARAKLIEYKKVFAASGMKGFYYMHRPGHADPAAIPLP